MRLQAGLGRRARHWLGETADHRLRYAEVLAQLEALQPSRVLEVGSGPVGLARYWPQGVVGVDLAFTTPVAPGLRPTVAPATELPFEDGSFPVVVSIDMLEHLPAAARTRAIGEMVRVARDAVIIACPCGSEARRAEAALGRDWRGPLPSWWLEHQAAGLPDAADVRQALQEALGDRSAHLSERPGGDCPTWLRLSRSLDRRLGRILAQRFWLLSRRFWQPGANQGAPYRTVFVCRLLAAPAPAVCS